MPCGYLPIQSMQEQIGQAYIWTLNRQGSRFHTNVIHSGVHYYVFASAMQRLARRGSYFCLMRNSRLWYSRAIPPGWVSRFPPDWEMSSIRILLPPNTYGTPHWKAKPDCCVKYRNLAGNLQFRLHRARSAEDGRKSLEDPCRSHNLVPTTIEDLFSPLIYV